MRDIVLVSSATSRTRIVNVGDSAAPLVTLVLSQGMARRLQVDLATLCYMEQCRSRYMLAARRR